MKVGSFLKTKKKETGQSVDDKEDRAGKTHG